MPETTNRPQEPASELTTFRRAPQRGTHDRSVIDGILDEGYLCHVGIVDDDPRTSPDGPTPVVIPTLYARLGDHLVLHGSPASRLLRRSRSSRVCVTVSLVDGFVLARSAFHHSMNYRSVVVFGRPEVVPDGEKPAVLDALVERIAPGRVDHVRPVHDREVRGTLVLRLPLDEASAKVRSGDPIDDEEDYDLPVWAGVVPVTTGYGPPRPDPRLMAGVPLPDHVRDFRRQPRRT